MDDEMDGYACNFNMYLLDTIFLLLDEEIDREDLVGLMIT